MAIPLGAAVINAVNKKAGVAALAGAAASSASHSLLGFLEPLARELTYDGNWLWPNAYLSTHESIGLFLASDYSWDNLRWLLNKQGVNLPPQAEGQVAFQPGAPDSWQKYIVSKQTTPPVEQMLAMQYLGRIADPKFLEWMLRHGFKEQDVLNAVRTAPWIFSPEQSRILVTLERIKSDIGIADPDSEAVYPRRLAAAAMPHPDDRAAFEKLIQPPTYQEVTELAQRDLLVGDGKTFKDRGNAVEQRKEFNRLMALEGFTDPKIIEYLWALRERLPTEGELIEAAVKNAFVGPLAKILRLDDEYDEQPQFIVGTDRLGLSGSPFIELADMKTHIQNHRLKAGNEVGNPPHVLLHDETEEEANHRAEELFNSQDKSLLTWAQMLWRSHWVNLSPSQIYIGLHRCRPIDLTRPEAAEGQKDYDEQLAELATKGAANTAEARYEIARTYSERFGRILTVPGTDLPVPPVTMDIVRTVLRANDYAPLFRDTLAAISYNTLRLVDIRRMVQQALKDELFSISAIGWTPGRNMDAEAQILRLPPNTPPRTVFVQAWAREQYLDRGQTPDSALSLSFLAVQTGKQTNSVIATASNPAGRRRWVRLLERAYRVGVITKANFDALTAPGMVAAVIADDDVFADIFAEEDVSADTAAEFELTSYQDLLTAEDYADDAVFDMSEAV